MHRGEERDISITASVSSLSAGILWFIFFITYLFAIDLLGVALAIFYWSASIILFGITFFLMGIRYLKRNPTTLNRFTGLSFLIVGFIGIIVGYIGGFTLLPWFSVYDFPWVTALAIIPCCFALANTKSDGSIPVVYSVELKQ